MIKVLVGACVLGIAWADDCVLSEDSICTVCIDGETAPQAGYWYADMEDAEDAYFFQPSEKVPINGYAAPLNNPFTVDDGSCTAANEFWYTTGDMETTPYGEFREMDLRGDFEPLTCPDTTGPEVYLGGPRSVLTARFQGEACAPDATTGCAFSPVEDTPYFAVKGQEAGTEGIFCTEIPLSDAGVAAAAIGTVAALGAAAATAGVTAASAGASAATAGASAATSAATASAGAATGTAGGAAGSAGASAGAAAGGEAAGAAAAEGGAAAGGEAAAAAAAEGEASALGLYSGMTHPLLRKLRQVQLFGLIGTIDGMTSTYAALVKPAAMFGLQGIPAPWQFGSATYAFGQLGMDAGQAAWEANIFWFLAVWGLINLLKFAKFMPSWWGEKMKMINNLYLASMYLPLVTFSLYVANPLHMSETVHMAAAALVVLIYGIGWPFYVRIKLSKVITKAQFKFPPTKKNLEAMSDEDQELAFKEAGLSPEEIKTKSTEDKIAQTLNYHHPTVTAKCCARLKTFVNRGSWDSDSLDHVWGKLYKDFSWGSKNWETWNAFFSLLLAAIMGFFKGFMYIQTALLFVVHAAFTLIIVMRRPSLDNTQNWELFESSLANVITHLVILLKWFQILSDPSVFFFIMVALQTFSVAVLLYRDVRAMGVIFTLLKNMGKKDRSSKQDRRDFATGKAEEGAANAIMGL